MIRGVPLVPVITPSCRGSPPAGRLDWRSWRVSDVEEIASEANSLPFADAEVFDERKVPVLLERPAVNVAPEVAEICAAEVGLSMGSQSVGYRSGTFVKLLKLT
jgi:hypothetical protein